MKPIEEFCKTHNVCSEGRKWAIANCKDMQEVWSTARPDWVVWVATRPGVLTDNELHRFAVFCARSVEHLLTDERSKTAIEVAERYANGEASIKELETARVAACAAAEAARFAAYAALGTSWVATDGPWATRSAAYAALGTTDASWAAWAAVDASGAARVPVAARAAQASWLRANTTPTF